MNWRDAYKEALAEFEKRTTDEAGLTACIVVVGLVLVAELRLLQKRLDNQQEANETGQLHQAPRRTFELRS